MEEQNTIEERIGQALKGLRVKLSPTDKKICKEKFNISEATLNRYLGNKVSDATLAANMLSFFKGQLAAREASLVA